MTRTDEALEQAIAPLEALYEELTQEKGKLDIRLGEIKEELKKIERLLNIIESKSKTKRTKKKDWTPAPERMVEAQKFVNSVEDFSAADLAAAMNVSGSYGNKVVKDMREQGIVRLVRMEKVGPKGAGKMIYKAVK